MLSLIVLCGIFAHVYGWGPIGHSVVARLAQTQLNGPAQDWVRHLVPWHWNGNLSAMASWADSILYPDSNPTGYDNWQWTRPFHYINIPNGDCTYRIERDCINDICVDGAIRNYTKRLESKLDDIQHQEALYFLIHYVGDLHQPLHTGFKDDYGGNRIQGRFMNRTTQTNLHSLWDSGILNYRIQKDFYSNASLYYEYIYELMIRQIPITNDNDIQQWIKESLNFVCHQIYLDDNNNKMNASVKFNLGEKYYQRNFPIIDQRLATGGRRLGVLLNRLGQNQPTTSVTNTINTKTYILIAVISGVIILCVVILIFLCIRYRNKK